MIVSPFHLGQDRITNGRYPVIKNKAKTVLVESFFNRIHMINRKNQPKIIFNLVIPFYLLCDFGAC